MDWGLALPLPERGDGSLHELMPEALRTSDDALLGTPRDMAPELLRGQAPGVRTDIYALGVMLYELLALRRPHDAASVPALVMQITEGEFMPLAEVAPRLSRSIVAVDRSGRRDRPELRRAALDRAKAPTQRRVRAVRQWPRARARTQRSRWVPGS